MKYVVRVMNPDGVAYETHHVSQGGAIVSYTMHPKVKKSDMKYGRLVYTSWVPGEFTPLVSITEVP
jgi:hypothetical protein